MRDQPSEICNLLNLISPLDKQLNKKEFKNIFFDENKFKDEMKNEFKSYIIMSEDELEGLPTNELAKIPLTADKKRNVSLTKTLYSNVERFLSKESSREKLYMAFNKKLVPRNVPLLEELIVERHALA
jgi:Zn-dependent oligopeptidase